MRYTATTFSGPELLGLDHFSIEQAFNELPVGYMENEELRPPSGPGSEEAT